MVEFRAFDDAEQATKWFSRRDNETIDYIKVRAALRDFVTVYRDDDAQTEMLALVVLRALVVSAAAASADTAGRKPFIGPAAKAHGAACRISDELRPNPGVSNAADSAKYAVYCCAGERHPTPKDAADAIHRSINLPGGLEAIASDADEPGMWSPLWHEAGMGADLSDLWNELKNKLGSKPAYWSFWIEWYEAILAGNPLPWELTRRIALQVTEDEWEDGPAAVAKAVAPIYLPHKLERQIAELQAELAAARSRDRGIGDNNPPEPIENAALEHLPPIIWNDLEALKAESASLRLNPSRLLWFQQRFTDGAARIGQLAKDIAYDETKQIVSGVIGASIALNWIKIQQLVLNISETIAQWIAYIV